jgi:hypothetical protein
LQRFDLVAAGGAPVFVDGHGGLRVDRDVVTETSDNKR